MAPLTPAQVIEVGFRCIGRDIRGNIVFHMLCDDGELMRVVYPGRDGDTPVFVGRRWPWTLVGTLRWPVIRTREGVYLLPHL
jgi:hypothetical protein